jgi:hypothetical protein
VFRERQISNEVRKMTTIAAAKSAVDEYVSHG